MKLYLIFDRLTVRERRLANTLPEHVRLRIAQALYDERAQERYEEEDTFNPRLVDNGPPGAEPDYVREFREAWEREDATNAKMLSNLREVAAR